MKRAAIGLDGAKTVRSDVRRQASWPSGRAVRSVGFFQSRFCQAAEKNRLYVSLGGLMLSAALRGFCQENFLRGRLAACRWIWCFALQRSG